MEMTPDMLKKAIKCGIIKIEDLDESEIMRLIDEEVKSMGVIIPEITIKTDKGKTRYVCNIPREYSIDGKRHQVSASTREKCEEKFKKEILRLSKEKKRIEEEKAKGDKTVDELFDEWFVFRRGAVKGATLTMNRVLYDKHIKNSDFGKIKIKEISLIECEEFLKTLYHKNLAVGSVKLIKSMISTAFDYAVAHDYIEKNYMRYSKINANLCTGIYHSECNAWTDDEIRQLWDESERLWKEKRMFRHSALLMVLIFTGCRVGEIIALTWDDVDFEHRRINISKNYSRIRDEETGKYIDIITTPKTEESRREILLNDAALYWLKEMKSRNEELGIGTGTDDRIVVSKKNKILRQCNVDNRLKTFCEKIGVEYKSSHSGRKTYTSVLLDNGASLSDVSQELGHKNISTTQNSYYKSRRTRDAKLQQRNEIFRATAGSRLVVKKNIPEAAEIQGITA